MLEENPTNQNLEGGEEHGMHKMQTNLDHNAAGLETNVTSTTQNSEATSKTAAGPSGSGPNNQTYNQPPAHETYTPGTRYSEPFNDRHLNAEPSAPVTDVLGQPIGNPDDPQGGNLDGLRYHDGPDTEFEPSDENPLGNK